MQKWFHAPGVSFSSFPVVIPTVYTKVWRKKELEAQQNPQPKTTISSSLREALLPTMIEDARPPWLHGVQRVYTFSALAPACSPKASNPKIRKPQAQAQDLRRSAIIFKPTCHFDGFHQAVAAWGGM